MTRLFPRALAALLLCVLAAAAQAAPPRPAHGRPNLDVYAYRRSYVPGEQVQVRLSAYNLGAAQFTAYKMDLPHAVKTSTGLTGFGKTLRGLSLSGLPVAASWRFAVGRTYPDQWAERAVALPRLPPGVYLVAARGGGVEKRTWLTVTAVALLAKRSRQETLISATDAQTGRPLPGLALTVYGGRGLRARATTDADGVCRFASPGPDPVWVYGERAGSPAFALAAIPPAPEPFLVYQVTDRPLYRPGQTVQYKAVIRARTLSGFKPGAAPGGALRPLADAPAVVEIRDGTDALLSRRTARTDADGSLAGSFELAPETALGRWQTIIVLGEHRYYGGFEVQAYRKPEMTVSVAFGAAHTLGGASVPADITARYFFGQPVARAPVAYHVEFDGPDAEPSFDGQGVTDGAGRLHLDIPTKRRPSDRTLSVSATVTDLSRRSQSGSADTLVAAGLFRLSLETDKSVYKAGERVSVTVHSLDYDDRPVAARVRVRLIETKLDRQRRPTQVVTTREVQTDARGAGTALFAPPRPGDLRLEAEAFDAQDDKITADGSVWVAGDADAGDDYPTLALVPARTGYAPGETATLLLNTSLVGRPARAATRNSPAQAARPDAWALVTLEGERLGRHVRLHLTRRSTLVRLPLTGLDFPSVSVNVAIVQDHQVFEQQVRLSVARREQKLSVTVTPDKDSYQPGETANYVVTARDAQGRPARAELSLGVVDASIYALAPDSSPDLESVFYPDQEVRVQTEFSFAAQYSGGAYQTVPSARPPKTPPGEPARLRRRFADTAYWNPFLVTGADGTARASVPLPDNLTTWRATARGVTRATQVGGATASSVSSLPLLVRLALPRFAVRGDTATVSAIVQNASGKARTVRVSLQASGAALVGASARTVQIASGGQERLDWSARMAAPAPESADAGGVRFTVTADGGAGARDATEATLPALEPGLKVVTAAASVLSDPSALDSLDLSALPPNASVTLTLSPSLASTLAPASDSLADDETGGAERTLNSFQPEIVLSYLPAPQTRTRPGLARRVGLGLQTLYHYQHPDGGWNWWEGDQTDGDMTALVLSGLSDTRRAGYLVDEQRVQRGAEALKRLLSGERDLDRRADWLMALAAEDPKAAAKPLAALYAKRGHLDTYGLASFCLALVRVGGPAQTAQARTAAQELEARATVKERLAFWTNAEAGATWRGDPAAVTAHALRALLAARPQSGLSPGAVRWLMADRQRDAWGTARATSEALRALADFVLVTGELAPNFTATVSVDGAGVGSLAATPGSVPDAPLTLTLTPDRLRGHKTLAVTKSGAGTLYESRVVTSTLPPDRVTPQSHGLAVRRVFRVSAEDPSSADTQPSGSEMDVQVEISADAAYRHVRLEDPVPAGFQVVPAEGDGDGGYALDSSEGDAGYTRQEVRDDRVVFFFDRLPAGRTRLTYRLRAETPGVFQVLPGVASLSDFPEVRGSGGLVRAKVGETAGEKIGGTP